MMNADSLRSLITGLGDPMRDKSAGLVYQDYMLSDEELLHAYRNSWIAKKAVNIPAMDALRKWRHWQADQAQITLLEAEEKRLGLQLKLLQCKVLARLWGGAGIVIGVRGQDTSTPFDPESVKQGGIEYLTVMSRRELASKGLMMDPMSEWYGRPEGYQVSNGTNLADVHPSRVVVQVGDPHPDPFLATGPSNGWGDSSLQAVYRAMLNSDSTNANVASLVFEANVDVFGVPGLMEHMASEKYRQKLLDRFTLAAAGKSITKSLIRDTEEEYERHSASFAALPDVMQQMILFVSGAADIPLTRFLGQSPAGMSSTGQHDMKNYHDRIQSIQTLEVQPALWRLDEALIRSALGSRPSELFYSWAPLEQMSEKEQAEIAKLNAETANVLVGTGLFMQEELREVVGNQLVESGQYPGLADLLARNGEALPEFDLERRAQEAGVAALQDPEPKTEEPVADASPRTLYMRRDVVNAGEIISWYKQQGVPEVYAPESMHVTIVYSKTPVDWMKMGQPWEAKLEVPEGGPRIMEKFGPAGDVLVLLFASNELQWRHGHARDIGASSDFPDYQPHISISLRAAEVDLANIKPWTGKVILGPEVYEEIDGGDWRAKVETDG